MMPGLGTNSHFYETHCPNQMNDRSLVLDSGLVEEEGVGLNGVGFYTGLWISGVGVHEERW